MSTLVCCDWCGVITECERRDLDEWVCSQCWAHHLEQVRELYDPKDGPISEEQDEQGAKTPKETRPRIAGGGA